MPTPVRQRGLLYDQAAAYARALEAGDETAALTMLNAWSDGYWGVRKELDQFWAKVAAARAAGERTSPAWAFQQRRLQQVLDETSRQMARYSQAAALVTEQRQRAAIQEGLDHAQGLATTVVQEGLPGLAVDLGRTNPAVLNAGVGFLADGSVLRNHLAKTLPGPTVDGIRDVLVHGLATGKGQDWMIRQATRTLGLAHGRATTILRTESLRAYRAASQATYEANANVLGGWVWNAHLDARTCVACVLMDGTEHPLNATLDGHPRCRCAMIPRTRSWEDILGPDGADLPDTRPPTRSGKAWLEAQSPTTQRAIIGRAKFTAWQEGHITLDDMVARRHDADWGTMRTERSLKAITEGRDANWTDDDLVAHPTPPGALEPIVEAPEAPVDPFAGTTDDQLRARMVTGSMSERRAAQTELVRRKDAETVKAGEARRAILDRYAGDGTTWNRVDELPDTYQRGRHTAIVREDLGDALDGFLADAGDALDRMPEDLRRITVLVPKRGTDKHFRDSPTGITGGYVTEGLDFVNINPTVAKGLDLSPEDRTRQFMPGSEDVTVRQWTLNHELGHIMDHGHGHTHDARPAGAAPPR